MRRNTKRFAIHRKWNMSRFVFFDYHMQSEFTWYVVELNKVGKGALKP